MIKGHEVVMFNKSVIIISNLVPGYSWFFGLEMVLLLYIFLYFMFLFEWKFIISLHCSKQIE